MSNPSQIESIFFAALDKTSSMERADYLDRACGDDDALRHRVERLLEVHPRVANFLAEPAVGLMEFDPRDGIEDLTRLGPPSDSEIFPTPPPGRAGLIETFDDGLGGEENQALRCLLPSERPGSPGRLAHYEVLEVLGSGGSAIVVKAFDEKLRRHVALKILSPLLATTSAARKRFAREARAAAAVRHENVVTIHAVEDRPVPYLVMEYIAGRTLQRKLDEAGPLALSDVLRIGQQAAAGLAASHARGLIHRDVKPSNILLEGAEERVKLTDFGLARATDDASGSHLHYIAGTPMYMAPEQASGHAVDQRADLFSLGSVLYAMGSGLPPFRAANTIAVLRRVAEDAPLPIREIVPEVPEWLCELIAGLHAKDPALRISSAQDVADLLARRLAELRQDSSSRERSSAGPPGEKQAPPPPPRPRRRRMVAAALIPWLLVGMGLGEATGITNVRGTVIRLFSPEGTLVVEVDDPGVSVKIDGPEIVITGAGVKEIRLRPGRYTLKASKDGQVVRQELVDIIKDDRRVVRVSREPPPAVSEKKGIGEPTDQPDRRAADYVLSVGGTVKVAGILEVENNARSIRNAADLPRELFRLTGCELSSKSQATDAGLAHFQGCKNLTQLNLAGTQATDAGLAHFQGCKNLTYINLSDTQATDAGLAHFQGCDNLLVLHLVRTKITGAGLAYFKDCKALRSLDLNWTPVTDAGVAHFEGCKDLMTLSLAHTEVSDAGLAHFKDCRNLSVLALGDIPIGDAGLAHLKDCKKLSILHLDGTRVSDAGLSLLEDYKLLEILLLDNNPKVSDAGLANLKGCKALRQLRLENTSVTAAGVADLKKALPACKIKWNGGVVMP